MNNFIGNLWIRSDVTTTSELAVMVTLFLFSGGDHVVTASAEEIASMSRCTERTVRRAIGNLEAKGVISRVKGRSGPRPSTWHLPIGETDVFVRAPKLSVIKAS